MASQTPYLPLMQQLGLSTHVQQLVRRRAKYPNHFTIVNNHVFVTEQYATAIAAAKNFTIQIQQLKTTTHDIRTT